MVNYKTQGATVDHVYVLGEDGDLDRQSAYAALSRGRVENRLYMLEPDEYLQGQLDAELEPIIEHVEQELSRDREQRLASEHYQLDLTRDESRIWLRDPEREPSLGLDIDW